ncbi:MAG TPA: tetratricopeptide repeat protein [Burkholderiaceae bacterium]|nr:tetratricopeptide repeat protein [Burkholderiaceae bacterium]
MTLIDRDIAECNALVVDANPTSRSILAAQLRDFGVVNVTQTSRVTDARRALEVRRFDIVLCEQYFTADGATGQDLLDDLRRANLLPYSTVFVMITGESSYDKVAEAAESALDSYLLKPHTAAALGERLRQSRHRKRELAPIFGAIEREQFEQAARLCLQRFRDRGPYWLYAARIGAELLLRLQKPDAARQLYQAVIDAQALPWAKLGVARAQVDEGQPTAAQHTLEALLTAHPNHADAYDVMGRIQVEQGQLAQALETFRLASAATPNSIARLQKHGLLAYYHGAHDEAARALDRAALLGISSKLFDPQSLVVLGFVRFTQRDGKGLQRCLDNLLHAAERDPENARLARFGAVLQVLQSMLQRQVAAALATLRAMTLEIRADAFDVEAACNLLTLLAHLTAAEIQLDEIDAHVDALALRFASSRGMTELLARAASPHAPHEQRVRDAQQRITQLAEASLAHALAGDARSAVKALVAHGASTGNTKLLDTARGTLARYRDKIADADDLAGLIAALRARYAAAAMVPPLGQAQGRATGGVVLRAAA